MTGIAGDAAELVHLRALVEAAPVAMAVLDATGGVIAGNAAYVRLVDGLGAQSSKRGDRAFDRPLVEFMARADREDILSVLSKLVLNTSSTATLADIRLDRRSGRDRRITLHLRRIDDASRELVGIAAHLVEATGAGVLDERQLHAQKLQALGQLAGGIAHDFNNLLTAILGHCELLGDRLPVLGDDGAEVREIRRHAERGSRLIRQLLTFARRQPDQPEDLCVDTALRDLSGLLGRLLGETIRLDLDLAADRGITCIDPGQFDQVVLNLAVNARDAMPNGGTLSIRTQTVDHTEPRPAASRFGPPTLYGRRATDRPINVLPVGRHIQIEVADTGAGIAREILGNIFDPFFSTKAPGAGTGLGLATVYGIVSGAGGHIAVDSAPNAGTVFVIHLPALEQEAAASPSRHTPAPVTNTARNSIIRAETLISGTLDKRRAAAGSGATILLVEDENPIRALAARALAQRGHEVLEAGDGEAAFKRFSATAGRVDLIVSDVVMPVMDGFTLVRLVRQDVPNLPVILVSGYADEPLDDDLRSDPSIRYLPKPFTLSRLCDEVETAIGRPRAV